jgi:hypothetical protein
MAYKSSPRGSRPTDKIAVHTAEGARTAASLGAYFFRPDIQASSHVGIDAFNTLQYVGYDRAAWTLRSGNPISDNAELCGFARWTREQWLSTGVVDGGTNPRAILDRTGDWIASRARARGVPVLKLVPAQVAAGYRGVIGHVDWTLGMHDGTHTDPGPGFPWDYVINRALGGGEEEDDMQLTDEMPVFDKKQGRLQVQQVWAGILSRLSDPIIDSARVPGVKDSLPNFVKAIDNNVLVLGDKLDKLTAAQTETNRQLAQLVQLLTTSSKG